MIRKIVSAIASYIPTTNIIVFNSVPDCSDNAYAICKFFSSTKGTKEYRMVWLVGDYGKKDELLTSLTNDGIKALVIKKVSLMGIWMFIRARYVFVTHGLFDGIKLHQHNDKVICLWHGMPLKTLGASEERGIPCSTNFNYTIATSIPYQKIMAEAFATTIDRVLVTGLPRNDMLFEKTDWFELVGIDRSKYSKIGIWMPTYRKAIKGDIRIDGEYNEHAVSFLEEEDMRQLDDMLEESNTLLILKIHQMDALQNANFESFKNIVVIKPQDFFSQLYPLLGTCDFLLTDYSSVFIDYQILHRPIGFVMNDVDSYKNSRGFYFKDLEKVLPGPILDNFEKLVSFIRAPYIVNSTIELNEYYDSKSSQRICEKLNII
jgi:CDP-glycerol glycerophosphotransferase (TagB/SpsB family)